MYRPRFKGIEENPIRATNTRTWCIDEAAVKPVGSCGFSDHRETTRISFFRLKSIQVTFDPGINRDARFFVWKFFHERGTMGKRLSRRRLRNHS